jgi:hypothetical protein
MYTAEFIIAVVIIIFIIISDRSSLRFQELGPRDPFPSQYYSPEVSSI